MLLLDEPTNDLDFAGLELLDRLVARHGGGLVAVSHDRAFLEQMTTIVELEAETHRVRVFDGGWSAFAAKRKLARERDDGVVVAVLADGGWKYLSADFWDAVDVEESMERTVWW